MLVDVDEIAKLLLKLVKIYTPSGRESELHDVLSEIVEEFGYEERYVDEVGNFIARPTAMGSPYSSQAT